MFSGFKSRCMIFCSCINSTPFAISSYLTNFYPNHAFSLVFCIPVWIFRNLIMQTLSLHQIHNHIKCGFSFENLVQTYKLLGFKFPHNIYFEMHCLRTFWAVIHIFFINAFSCKILFGCLVSY